MTKKTLYYLLMPLVIFGLIFEIIYYFSDIKDFEKVIAVELDIVITFSIIVGVFWLYKKSN